MFPFEPGDCAIHKQHEKRKQISVKLVYEGENKNLSGNLNFDLLSLLN
jgi:hypothetical protein